MIDKEVISDIFEDSELDFHYENIECYDNTFYIHIDINKNKNHDLVKIFKEVAIALCSLNLSNCIEDKLKTSVNTKENEIMKKSILSYQNKYNPIIKRIRFLSKCNLIDADIIKMDSRRTMNPFIRLTFREN